MDPRLAGGDRTGSNTVVGGGEVEKGGWGGIEGTGTPFNAMSPVGSEPVYVVHPRPRGKYAVGGKVKSEK